MRERFLACSRAGPPGHLPFNSIANGHQDLPDSIQLFALDFNLVVFESSASPTLGLELGQQARQIVPFSEQAADHGDPLSVLAFLDQDRCRLFLRGLPNRFRWRALTFGFQHPAAFAFGGTVERGAFEESHEKS